MRCESDQLEQFHYHDAWLKAVRWEDGDLVMALRGVTPVGAGFSVPEVTLRFLGACLTGVELSACEMRDAKGDIIESRPPTQLPQEAWLPTLLPEQDSGYIYDLSEKSGVISIDLIGNEALMATLTCARVLLTWEDAPLRWLFFDVGSTLVDESAAYDRRIREMIAGTGVSYEQFQRKREAFARQNRRGDLEAAAFFGLPKTPWHHEDEHPYPEAAEVLRALRGRGYRIGVIANQAAGTADRLRAWGLLEYIDLVIASAEAGVAKPDPAIFRLALKRAGCAAAEAVMIGDRLDNDIAPAKTVGMRTVWLPQGPAVWHSVRREAERPDVRVEGLRGLLEVLP
ncbi:MAG: HAD-IIIA family hydrolase [Clostridia bacterium]|nr:HAD-IIIA family hydrolase [Clostridia bacterium]